MRNSMEAAKESRASSIRLLFKTLYIEIERYLDRPDKERIPEMDNIVSAMDELDEASRIILMAKLAEKAEENERKREAGEIGQS